MGQGGREGGREGGRTYNLRRDVIDGSREDDFASQKEMLDDQREEEPTEGRVKEEAEGGRDERTEFLRDEHH